MNWYKNIKIADFPIGDFKAIGDISSHAPEDSSFSNYDKNILNSPKAIENIKKRWEKVGPWVNVYFYNNPGDILGKGEINNKFYDKLKDPNKIGLIITSSQDHPTSAWMIAHRLAHAIYDDKPAYSSNLYFSTIQYIAKFYTIHVQEELSDEYKNNKDGIKTFTEVHLQNLLLAKILTMKSARTDDLSSVEEGFNELFAQYLMTGKITVNPLPKKIEFEIAPFKIKAILSSSEGFNYKEALEKRLPKFIDKEIEPFKGKIIVD